MRNVDRKKDTSLGKGLPSNQTDKIKMEREREREEVMEEIENEEQY